MPEETTPPPADVPGAFERAVALVAPVDEGAADAARARHATLLKPPGALGRLEEAGIRLAAIAGTCPPPMPEPVAVAVFASDHGVHAQGLTPWPQEVTALLFGAFARGGAAIRVIGDRLGARVVPVDVGIATDVRSTLDAADYLDHRIAPGTRDLSVGPAMSDDEARQALDVGAATARDLVADGVRCLVTGEMGIANTTSTACLLALLLGLDPAAVTGRGTGIDDIRLARKLEVVEQAVARVRRDHGSTPDPLTVLAEVGGFELVALAGFIVGGAAAGVPVVVDGIIATASAVAAEAMVPGVAARCFSGHRSAEPGADAALAHLGLDPLLDLGLRLGEGTGALLAVPLLQASGAVLTDMATLADVGLD